MLPQYACNLPAASSDAGNSVCSDWNLHVTSGWERRIPFCLHIHDHATATSSQQPEYLFPQFSKLPAELQVRVLTFCAPSTLFKARQTSSTIYVEASKLFWADLNTYFTVPARWLSEGGYPGYAWWDSSFQDYVQNVEIEYNSDTDRIICPRTDEKTTIQQNQIKAFWTTFRKRFPSAKRVILNQNARIPPWWEDAAPVPLPLRVLTYACPLDIEVFALVLEEQVPLANKNEPRVFPLTQWKRSLYRPGAGGAWEALSLGQLYRTVLMPPKQFSGPVGMFQQLDYRLFKTSLRREGLWLLMIEAVGQHYFEYKQDNVLFCPSHGCNACFTKPGEWVIHAAEHHCREWRKLEIVPDTLKATFEECQSNLVKEDEDVVRCYKATKAAWNEDDEHKRKEIERGWMEQLDKDKAWDTGKTAKESKLWSHFSQQMSPNWEGFYVD